MLKSLAGSRAETITLRSRTFDHFYCRFLRTTGGKVTKKHVLTKGDKTKIDHIVVIQTCNHRFYGYFLISNIILFKGFFQDIKKVFFKF